MTVKDCTASSMSQWIALTMLLSAICGGCTSQQRPVLYPNAKYEQVGAATARQDIDDCIRLAKQAGVSQGGGERAVQQGAVGAAVGSVTGAVAGAISGHNVVGSAAAGAAVGGAAAGTHGAINAGEPSAIHK